MQEFNEGDLVEAVKGETVIRGRVTSTNTTRWITVGDAKVIIPRETWTVTVIEKAAPKLPSEVGAYLDKYEHDVWTITPSHGLRCVESWTSSPEKYAPFTRLEPVPVTAKKVLDAIRGRIGSIDSAHDFQAVATQFGVSE